MSRKLLITAIGAACLAFVVAACGQDASERAGESADSAYKNATQGRENLTDGPMENAGERIDDAATDAGAQVNRGGDNIEDAKSNNLAP